MVIHQMMLLMHLEMQLRQQALVSYQETHDPAQRMQRLDDVMALNEQLNEVGSILGTLLNVPLDRGAASRESTPDGQHSPSTVGGRFAAAAADESSLGSLLPTVRLRVLDTVFDEDDDDADSDTFDEDYGRASSSSSSSVWYSYDFDSLRSSSRRPDRTTVADAVNPAGRAVTTSVNSSDSPAAVITGTGTDHHQLISSVPVASTGHSSTVLSRRRDRPTTPRWARVEQTAVSVTVNELHLPDGLRSQLRPSQSQRVSLQHIQSATRRVTPAVQASLIASGDHVRLAAAGSQLTVSTVSSIPPRQLEPLSRNRSSGMSLAAHSQLASSRAAEQLTSSTNSASSTSTSQLQSTDGCTVLTEPWPILPPTDQHSSLSVSTSRPAVRADESRLTHAHATQGPRRTVHETHSNRPALPLPRSSVRNVLGRPAGPSSVSAIRPSASQGPRVVALPHPPVRGGRQQGFGDRSTAGSDMYASNEILRPRRRSEIARDIMFPPQKDTEQ